MAEGMAMAASSVTMIKYREDYRIQKPNPDGIIVCNSNLDSGRKRTGTGSEVSKFKF